MTSHNVKDLRAQVAANQRGIVLVTELIDECGLDVVLAYMQHIQENAEVAVREMLMERAAKVEQDEGLVDGKAVLSAVDYLDDGSPICLKISITPSTGDATFDFEGTGDEIFGNLNAPRAVTYSAIIYCLRCMLGFDIPLNQGCLLPITIDIPHGCLLYPSDEAAVVGGNVLTSQRVTDVVLKAFAACAASSGCMNNITFGDATVGYYETVCGGAGAGPTWAGRSGVHTHMTNTRITDPEALERQYPVVLESFMLRDGSGGKGQYNGGDGVIRKMRYEALAFAVLHSAFFSASSSFFIIILLLLLFIFLEGGGFSGQVLFNFLYFVGSCSSILCVPFFLINPWFLPRARALALARSLLHLLPPCIQVHATTHAVRFVRTACISAIRSCWR